MFKKFMAVFSVTTLSLLIPLSVFASQIGTSVVVTSLTPGSTAAKLGKTEDAAHASADVGVMSLGVQSTTLAGLAGTTGDYAPLQVNALGALYAQIAPNTTGGLTIFRSIDIDETEEQIKATAGMLYACTIINDTAATKEYVKFYNDTAANVVVGTTAPVITIPTYGVSTINLNWPLGVAFDTAITVAATTGLADNDTGAPAANAVIVNCFYK